MKNIQLSIGETLNTNEAAAAMGLHPITLTKQRAEGRGVPYIRLGRKVMYRKADIEAYMISNYVGKPLAAV